MLGKDYEPMEVLAQGQDVQHVSAAAIMSDGDGDEGNDVGDGAIVADGNLRGRVVVLPSKEEDTADGDVDNMVRSFAMKMHDDDFDIVDT